MDKNDVGPGYIALKIGDTVQAGDQRYLDFCWVPVPKRKIGTVLKRMHWPMRRKAVEAAGIKPEDFAKSSGAQILQQDFQAVEAKVYGTLASLGLLHLLPKPFTPNKYTRDLVALDGRKVPVDVYCVSGAFALAPVVQNEEALDALFHARKKILAPGQRGAKGVLQDLKEARQSLSRAIAVLELGAEA